MEKHSACLGQGMYVHTSNRAECYGRHMLQVLFLIEMFSFVIARDLIENKGAELSKQGITNADCTL